MAGLTRLDAIQGKSEERNKPYCNHTALSTAAFAAPGRQTGKSYLNQKPDHLKLGQWGEEVACRFLRKKGYEILERNSRNRWGEIDIICKKTNPACSPYGGIRTFLRALTRAAARLVRDEEQKNHTLVFVEVKTLKRGALDPEENMTRSKIKKLVRACEIYLSAHNLELDSNWQIDVVAITLDPATRQAQIAHYENAL